MKLFCSSYTLPEQLFTRIYYGCFCIFFSTKWVKTAKVMKDRKSIACFLIMLFLECFIKQPIQSPLQRQRLYESTSKQSASLYFSYCLLKRPLTCLYSLPPRGLLDFQDISQEMKQIKSQGKNQSMPQSG